MVRLYMLVMLLVPLTQAFSQSSPPRKTNRVASTSQPISNQFEHLSVTDGLSNNSVNCIIQDREGFMWFGTAEGLNKYDGYTFTVFPTDPSDPHSFQNSHVSYLLEDRSNRLWAATEGGGLHEVNKQTGLITSYPITINGSRENQWNNQLTIYEDSQGVLWITTFAGLARFDPTSQQFRRYPTPESDVPFKTVFEDRQHRFWVATNRGLYLFDRSTGEFTPVPVQVTNGPQPAFMSFYLDDNDVLWMGTSTVGYSLFRLNLRYQPWHLESYNPDGQLHPYTFLNSLHRDKAGIIWVGTTSGLQSIDPASNKVFTYNANSAETKGISSNSAQAVYHDRTGMLWVGTDNGIDRQAVNIKPFETYQITPNKGSAHLPENRVNAILKDNYGQLWLTNLGNVYRKEPNKAIFEVVPPEKLGSTVKHKNLTYSFISDNSAGIWLGTPDGLYHFDQATGKYTLYPSEIPAQFISRAPTGNLWVGGEGGIASFNVRTHQYKYYKAQERRTELPDRYIQTLFVSRNGEVWVLIRRHGISRLNPVNGRFTRYTAGSKGQLSSNDVLSIYEDNDGIIWIGTHLGGLNRFDPQTGIVTVIGNQDGIPGNSVLGITGDNAGYLWLSTDKGICQFDPRTKTVHNYEVKNGLPSNDFQDNAVFRDRNELFFGSLNGAVHFNPSRFRNDNRQFPVRITKLSVMNQPRLITDSVVTLEHDENLLTFEFSALDYVLPEQNSYKYQLVGIDKNWVQSGNRHVANYTNLSPGTYTFRVKAANSDGVWSSQEASLRLIVQSPWWATWWAFGIYALLFLGVIWGYIRFYTNQIRQKQESELVRREAEQMKAVDEVKNRFFANISHEFRTPLTLILTPVGEMLQANQFDRQALLSVRNNANKILLLINQIMDLSKLEAHQMPISLVQGDIDEFINHIIELFRRAAEQKGVSLTYKAENLPVQNRLFDSDKWEKILMNLLANALKFTDTGGQITVTLIPVLKDGEIVSVQLAVADSGIGISPDKVDHIFDRFYQVDTSSTRAYEGTGIGLSLTKELVDVLGGQITVASQPNVGTTFLVTLPVSPVSDKAAYPSVILSDVEADIADQLPVLEADQDKTESPEESQVPQILIVEDNDELRTLLVRGLSSTYQVLHANNGKTGWELAQSELPDIVISDVMMPKMDGYELTRHIKTDPTTGHIAVVLLTAKAAQSSRVEGLEQGADDYLTKPFDLKELRLRLRNLLTRQQKLQEYHRQQLSFPDTPAPLTVVDDPFLLQIYELLERNLDNTDINVEWLADQLSINRKKLLRKVNSLLHLPPTDLIRQYRLRKAADLLRAGRNVSETADLVGFKTPSHFTNAFKEFYGKTPTQFINNK
jgi:signal transduction histidine kinase/ligand-binding sensor domain-containing protein/DNA-binding response OmpR family regulator